MTLTAEPPAVNERWRTVARLAGVLEAEVKSRHHTMGARVVSWFNLCRICQDIEEQILLAELSAEDRPLHRALLSSAIACGEGLLLGTDDSPALLALGYSRETLRAKVESLRITFEQWQTELHPERQAAILAEAFSAEV